MEKANQVLELNVDSVADKTVKITSGKIRVWVKSGETTPNGGKVKSRRIEMRPVKTLGQAKRSYNKKLELDTGRIGELQFTVKGRRLKDEEQVGQLVNKTVEAEGLCWCSLL